MIRLVWIISISLVSLALGQDTLDKAKISTSTVENVKAQQSYEAFLRSCNIRCGITGAVIGGIPGLLGTLLVFAVRPVSPVPYLSLPVGVATGYLAGHYCSLTGVTIIHKTGNGHIGYLLGMGLGCVGGAFSGAATGATIFFPGDESRGGFPVGFYGIAIFVSSTFGAMAGLVTGLICGGIITSKFNTIPGLDVDKNGLAFGLPQLRIERDPLNIGTTMIGVSLIEINY